MTILLYLALGLTIGGISGLLGIGGGVLLVPALMLFLHVDQRQAAGITLAVLALPVVVPAVWQYYAQDLIGIKDLAAAAWIAAAFAFGGYVGSSFARSVPLEVLRLGFGLFMIYIAMRFILTAHPEVTEAAVGLCTASMAWLAYVGLRALGRRHAAKPDLGEQIRRARERGAGEVEYYI